MRLRLRKEVGALQQDQLPLLFFFLETAGPWHAGVGSEGREGARLAPPGAHGALH